jgi:hypothetical protein
MLLVTLTKYILAVDSYCCDFMKLTTTRITTEKNATVDGYIAIVLHFLFITKLMS